MSRTVLCDVNVWLDHYFGDRSFHDSARRLILEGCKNDITFMVPASGLSDFFYLTVMSFKRGARGNQGSVSEQQALAAQESAWAVMENLLRTAIVVGSDMSDAEAALRFKDVHRDYEDDLVIAAALRAKPDCLVTRDERLRAKAPVLALDPDEAIAYFGLDF